MQYLVSKSSRLKGEIRVPGDKSISHRSIILGALANGTTTICGLLEGDDVLATIRAFEKMGVDIQRKEVMEGDSETVIYTISGVGMNGLQPPVSDLNLGNSGTAFRLLSGLLTAQPWSSTLTGDASLSARPMNRIIDPLKRMGGEIISSKGFPPLTVGGSAENMLRGITYETPMASAQVKSAILLAGLYAAGETKVLEREVTRDHTERMLSGFGYSVDIQKKSVTLQGGGRLVAQNIIVPGDLSSAAFFVLAGLVIEGSRLVIKHVGNNPSRNGVLGILQKMGGNIDILDEYVVGGEPVLDIQVSHSELKAVTLGNQEVSLAIDEIPVIAVAAACAKGVTHIRGATELRVKESDRIYSIVQGLRALGIEVNEYEDGMSIKGGSFHSGEVNSFEDHRIAMAFSIAAAVSSTEVVIRRCQNVATSFPDFLQLAQEIGMNITSLTKRER